MTERKDPENRITPAQYRAMRGLPRRSHKMAPETTRERNQRLKDMFKDLEPKAIRSIAWLACHSPDHELRLKASQEIVNRARGKLAEPPREFSGPNGGPIQIEHRPSLAKLLGFEDDMKPGAPIIDGVAEEE